MLVESILTATVLLFGASLRIASKTTPIPPWPILHLIIYLPTFWPIKSFSPLASLASFSSELSVSVAKSSLAKGFSKNVFAGELFFISNSTSFNNSVSSAQT